MRLAKPRITPLADGELTPEQVERLAKSRSADGGVLNIFRTLVRAPDAFRAFSWWGGYVLSRNSLSPRDREIVILRTGWLCKSGYEWTQHHRIGLEAGLVPAEIERIKAGAGAEGWTAPERALIAAADDLHRDQFVSHPCWAELGKHFSQRQCMDLVFTVGQYTQVSMILNSFGVQLDEGQTLDPDLKAF
ncbi:MAG: carboxymuconolactone decarboxylase family protein [Alphaproteobacteria bacterium]|nr:carboxymuconolactone decarboxylase family protein [Alphaproteobacteria bacterium]